MFNLGAVYTSYHFALGVIFVYATAGFVLSVIKKRNDIADVAWGLGFLLVAATLLAKNGFGVRGVVVVVLVAIWALRLSLHIYLRNRGKPEDYRYQKWRADWGKWFYPRSYLQVFLLQGLLLLVVSAPVIFIQTFPSIPFTALDFVGVAVWVFGFVFESVADNQLATFVKNPANHGHIIRTGLWQYSRHPNYFGEVSQWWGIFLVALSVPGGVYSIVGPLAITFLILKVSGVPLLEEKLKQKPEFAEYARATSMFVPWFKKV